MRGVRPLVAVLAVAALLGTGCGRPPGDAPEAESSAPGIGTPPPPVVLISIDTLRSDRLPAYGYDTGDTPAIDRLAGDGIVFERAYAHTPLTLPSHASILTGLLPPEHGVRDNQGYPFDASGLPFLPRILRERRYATGGAVSAYVLHREGGMGREGFDFYDDAVEPRPGVALGGVARAGSATLGAVEPWLREVAGDGPFFLFFHLFEPHAPYQPPEPFASRLADPYDGEVAAADAVVGELLAFLEELGVYDGAVVILLSDHGEGLGDHGEEQHGIFLYREAIQVPLIVKLPGGGRAGTRVASPAQLVDVVPTVLDVLGLPVPAELPGASLLSLPEAERPIYAETFYPRLHFGWSELTSLVSERHHFIDAPTPELYDLEADPAESRDLLRQERRIAAELRRRLEGFERPLEAPGAVDPETRARLAALGYLGGPADAGDGPLPDPKEKVHVLGELRAAAALVERGELAAAVERYRGALADSPGMVDGWQGLGDLLRRLGRIDEARDAYRQAFEAAGGDPHLGLGLALLELQLGRIDDARALIDAAAGAGVEAGPARRRLALALARAGRFGEAVAVLDPLARGGDPEAAATLGRVLSEAGRQEEAEAVLRRAVDDHPENAAAWEHLGLVHLRQERWADARDASQRAVELDPDRAEAWNNLGVARHQTGDPVAALDAWERAASLAPEPWDTLFNLGTRAADLGRPDQARAALRRFVDGAPADRYPRELQQARLLLRRLGG